MAESEAAAGTSFVLGSLSKKIRRLLQGKRHIKIELCVRLSVLLRQKLHQKACRMCSMIMFPHLSNENNDL